jgi:hypothetical protein
MLIGTILGTIAIVLITVLVGLLIDRRVHFLPRPADLAESDDRKPPPATYAAGEAPATAIRVRPGQLAKLRQQKCPSCRTDMSAAPDEPVRYNDRQLLVLNFTCPKCATRRTIYVEPAA